MPISISNSYPLIISILLVLVLSFLGYWFIFKKPNLRLNWAIFYSTLYLTVTLPIINYLCIQFGLWHFTKSELNSIQLPFDLYFLWVVIWGILPFLITKGKYLFLTALLLFWFDILLMPLLEEVGILVLEKNWLLGELLLICLVFIPSYYWAYCSYTKKYTWLRATFQILVIAVLFLIGLPFIIASYGWIDPIKFYAAPFTFQLLLILAFPSLVAVLDLVKKGKGTPFPFDPTNNLVRTGVYAYCQNPIQWSFTLIFIPLSIYHSSFYFLIGSIVSISYTYGVSNYHEYDDMKQRFGNDWNEYRMNVPKWRFLWRPKTIPKGQVFFDTNCTQCNQIRNWFINSKAINLEIKAAQEFQETSIFQVTYLDHNGIEYKSVQAIACSLEHINLAYATLGWFMRFPLITQCLQLIVDSMDFDSKKENCSVEE